jgi:hypothetical protein
MSSDRTLWLWSTLPKQPLVAADQTWRKEGDSVENVHRLKLSKSTSPNMNFQLFIHVFPFKWYKHVTWMIGFQILPELCPLTSSNTCRIFTKLPNYSIWVTYNCMINITVHENVFQILLPLTNLHNQIRFLNSINNKYETISFCFVIVSTKCNFVMFKIPVYIVFYVWHCF